MKGASCGPSTLCEAEQDLCGEHLRDLAARLAEVAQQSGAALEAAQRALQTQEQAFSQVTAERDLLAAEVGDLKRQMQELQARARRPWWAIWRGR